MHLSLALLFAATAPAAAPSDNFRFQTGRLTNWDNVGFYVTAPPWGGPSRTFGVCSSDLGREGRAALLHRTFVVPQGIGSIRFQAVAVRPHDVEPAGDIDVVLEASGRTFLPRLVRTSLGWQSNPALLPAYKGRPREYQWNVADYAGKRLRISLIDDDARPGCYLYCTGFQFVPKEESDGREFAVHMTKLASANRLTPMDRFETAHFTALSNAADEYTEHRLYNCETIYDTFFDHFRAKGFPARPPAGKLMVAVFDTQAGFDAYVGDKLPTSVTGIYHKPSNRLVVYDYGSNRSLVALKQKGEEEINQKTEGLQRARTIASFSRQVQSRRADANTSTIMHEVAHQLSFNCGLLNRQGDVAVWLAEGLATYCESTENGSWQGIGEANPMRARVLAEALQRSDGFIPLQRLVGGDDWLRQPRKDYEPLLGYSQSWALFRMLMEENPQNLRRYLNLVYNRRTPEQRLGDFVQAFGSLTKFESRYKQYLVEMSKQARPTKP